jgi:hypothetical protein
MTRKEIKLKQEKLFEFKKSYDKDTRISFLTHSDHTELSYILGGCVIKISDIEKISYELFIINDYDDGFIIFTENGYAHPKYHDILERCYVHSIEITYKSFLKLFNHMNANWDLTLVAFKGYPFEKWWPMYKRAIHQFNQLQLCRSASYMHWIFKYKINEWAGVFRNCFPKRFDALLFDYIGYSHLLPLLWPDGFKIWFKIPSFKKQFAEQKFVQDLCLENCVNNRHLIIIEKLQLQ